MKKTFLFILILSSFSTCKPSENEEVTLTVSAFSQLKVGNYWVYQSKLVKEDGTEEPFTTNKEDSVFISKDTLIKGIKYFVEEGTSVLGSKIKNYIRDSLNYLTDSKGRIRFASENFNDILTNESYVLQKDTLYTLQGKMDAKDIPVSVPAGNFKAYTFKEKINENPNFTTISNPRFQSRFYVSGIGKVKEECLFLGSNLMILRKLVAYKVK